MKKTRFEFDFWRLTGGRHGASSIERLLTSTGFKCQMYRAKNELRANIFGCYGLESTFFISCDLKHLLWMNWIWCAMKFRILQAYSHVLMMCDDFASRTDKKITNTTHTCMQFGSSFNPNTHTIWISKWESLSQQSQKWNMQFCFARKVDQHANNVGKQSFPTGIACSFEQLHNHLSSAYSVYEPNPAGALCSICKKIGALNEMQQ